MAVCIPMNLNKISLYSKCDFDTQENCMNFKLNIFILLQIDLAFDAEELISIWTLMLRNFRNKEQLMLNCIGHSARQICHCI